MNKQKKKYIDVNFYKLFLSLLKNFTPYYKNMDKDYKFCIGQKIYNLILECSELNIDSYYCEDLNTKYKLADKSYKILLKIEILLRYLYDLRIINENQLAIISKETAQIKISLLNWKISLENKKEKLN